MQNMAQPLQAPKYAVFTDSIPDSLVAYFSDSVATELDLFVNGMHYAIRDDFLLLDIDGIHFPMCLFASPSTSARFAAT